MASQELVGNQLLLPQPCLRVQLHHQGHFSRHWPTGLSCLPGSLGWGAEQGLWSVVSPSPWSPLPYHATAPQLPIQEER